jgi:hypothetical protein
MPSVNGLELEIEAIDILDISRVSSDEETLFDGSESEDYSHETAWGHSARRHFIASRVVKPKVKHTVTLSSAQMIAIDAQETLANGKKQGCLLTRQQHDTGLVEYASVVGYEMAEDYALVRFHLIQLISLAST